MSTSLLCIWVKQKLIDFATYMDMVCKFDTVYRKIPIYWKFWCIDRYDRKTHFPINRHWFQYRYFPYIGIPNILTNQVVLWLCIAFAHDVTAAMLVFQSKIIFKIRLFCLEHQHGRHGFCWVGPWGMSAIKRSIAQRQTVLLTSEWDYCEYVHFAINSLIHVLF
jgi:hypothetical protein